MAAEELSLRRPDLRSSRRIGRTDRGLGREGRSRPVHWCILDQPDMRVPCGAGVAVLERAIKRSIDGDMCALADSTGLRFGGATSSRCQVSSARGGPDQLGSLP
jgi:hypothetical protein